MLKSLQQDIRYSVRALFKSPSFTLAATLTLALGIGANTAIFSVVNAVLLRPLPFDEPDRIMQVWTTDTEERRNNLVVSVPDFLDWQERSQSFEQLAAYALANFTLIGAGEPERLRAARISANLFPLLRVAPAAGRNFLPEEDRLGGERVVIISHGLWQRRFGSDPGVLGRVLRFDNTNYKVIGIMPPGFNYPVRRTGATEVWTPHAFDMNRSMSKRSSSYLSVVGRLRENVVREQAQAEMDALARALAEQHPGSNRNRGVYIIPVHEQMVEKARPILLILFGAVTFLLLIACLNVANLLLARSSARYKETIIRSALGASRLRLIRPYLVESILLGLVGGGLGLLLAVWGLNALVALLPPEISSLGPIGLDRNVLVWTLAVSVLTGLLFGLVPALKFSRPALHESLKENVAASTAGPAQGRLRGVLVVVEIAASLVLLVGAGLLVKSLWHLQHVETGFEADNVLTHTMSLPSYRYADAGKQRAFHAQTLERLKALPGVTAAGMTTILPLSGLMEASDFQVVGKHSPESTSSANTRAVSPDYLRAIGIPLLKGRQLTAADNETAPPVCLINESMARKIFGGEEPLGWRVKTAGAEREIVGVVSDVKHEALSAESDFELYVPYTQYPFVASMNYVLRAEGSPEALANPVRAAVRELDPDQTVENVQTMEQVVLKSIAQPRFNTFLLSLLAGVALLIASIGLYGVISYMVAQRTREIGIRMALGAQANDVLRLVVGHGLKLSLIGIALGTLLAFASSRFLASLLFEVGTFDLWAFTAAPLLLLLVALAASYFPARYAMRVDPVKALRHE